MQMQKSRRSVCSYGCIVLLKLTTVLSEQRPLLLYCFQLASKLSYAEFCDLLDHVKKVDICEIDSCLRQLVSIPASQLFPGLIRCLMSRFPDSHRTFVGPDRNAGPVNYLV